MLLEPLTLSFIGSGEFAEYRARRDTRLSVEGVAPSSFPFITASLFNENPAPILVVTKNAQAMREFALDLSCFLDPRLVQTLAPYETLPYEFVSPAEKLLRERVAALYKMASGEPCVVVATVESLLRRVPPRDFLLKKGIGLSTGEDYPFDDIASALVDFGYTREHRVESFGQFSVKGGIIDVFLPTGDNPVRLDFFGDTLDSIREFDAESQISFSRLDSVTIFPRRELVLGASESAALRAAVSRERGDRDVPGAYLGDEGPLPGVEDLFPLLAEGVSPLAYLAPGHRVVFLESMELIAQRDRLLKVFDELYQRKSRSVFCLSPERLLDKRAFEEARARALELQVFTASPGALQWRMRSIPNYHGKIKQVREDLSARLADGWRAVICTAFEGQARRLFDLFGELGPAGGFEELDADAPLSIVLAPLREGVELAAIKTLLLTDHDIFGKSYRKKRQFKRGASRPIESFLELEQGDYVVHINHGIGVFRGLERMAAGGVERDFLLIEYEGADRLYVSLDQITMVQKYIGMDGRTPRVDALGRKSAWNRIKDRVQRSVEEIAGELIQIYSKRRAMKGYQFPPDTVWQEEFESKFEYEETPDQITSVEDIKDDMEKAEPMDRLVCGDVGFGKTEVAIRAAFKAVMAGKQVAVLVPTTVLAMQHFSTFKKRFSEYPITIDMMSRFRTPSQLARTKAGLAGGRLDIVIGTHALLARDISIKNLGLLVIDEEQRFGVRHKEQLKKLRTLVDVLALSATPIPRTLHMSLSGIRDLSIIATPPENRQAIETYVIEENADIVRNAILKETERGGQVFYVHNRVQTTGKHLHNRVGPGHAERKHHHYKPGRHLRPVATLPDEGPRGALGREGLRVSNVPAPHGPVRNRTEAACGNSRVFGHWQRLQDRHEGHGDSRLGEHPGARAVGQYHGGGVRPLLPDAGGRGAQAKGREARAVVPHPGVFKDELFHPRGLHRRRAPEDRVLQAPGVLRDGGRGGGDRKGDGRPLRPPPGRGARAGGPGEDTGAGLRAGDRRNPGGLARSPPAHFRQLPRGSGQNRGPYQAGPAYIA